MSFNYNCIIYIALIFYGDIPLLISKLISQFRKDVKKAQVSNSDANRNICLEGSKLINGKKSIFNGKKPVETLFKKKHIFKILFFF